MPSVHVGHQSTWYFMPGMWFQEFFKPHCKCLKYHARPILQTYGYFSKIWYRQVLGHNLQTKNFIMRTKLITSSSLWVQRDVPQAKVLKWFQQMFFFFNILFIIIIIIIIIIISVHLNNWTHYLVQWDWGSKYSCLVSKVRKTSRWVHLNKSIILKNPVDIRDNIFFL